MADADATELQGNGEALGGNHGGEGEEKRKTASSRRVYERAACRFLLRSRFLFSSLKKKKWGWIRAKRVRGQAERMDGDSRASAKHGSPIAEPARARNFSLLQKQLKNNLTGFQARVEHTRHRVSNVSSRARGCPLSRVLLCMRLLGDDNPRSSNSAEPQRPENPVV